jgi:hypothetical protein
MTARRGARGASPRSVGPLTGSRTTRLNSTAHRSCAASQREGVLTPTSGCLRLALRGWGGACGSLPRSPVCIASQRGLTFPRFLPDGPRTRRWVMVPAPRCSDRRARIWGVSRRSWAAHVSESAVTVSSPLSKDSGVVWAATWGPTITGQLPKTEPTAARACQPLAERRSPRAVLRSSGSSRLGRADQDGDSGVSGVGRVRSGSAEED